MWKAQWFYRQGGIAGDSTNGPFTTDVLSGLCRDGTVGRDTLVAERDETSNNWVRAGDRPALLHEIEEGEAERKLNSHLVREYRIERGRNAIAGAGRLVFRNWRYVGPLVLLAILVSVASVLLVGAIRWMKHLSSQADQVAARVAREQRNAPRRPARAASDTTGDQSLGEMWYETFQTYKNPDLIRYLKGDVDFSSLPAITRGSDLREGYGSRGPKVRFKFGAIPNSFVGDLSDGTDVCVFLAEGQEAHRGTIDLTNQLVVVHHASNVLYAPGKRKPMMSLTVVAPRYADAAAEYARSR